MVAIITSKVIIVYFVDWVRMGTIKRAALYVLTLIKGQLIKEKQHRLPVLVRFLRSLHLHIRTAVSFVLKSALFKQI